MFTQPRSFQFSIWFVLIFNYVILFPFTPRKMPLEKKTNGSLQLVLFCACYPNRFGFILLLTWYRMTERCLNCTLQSKICLNASTCCCYAMVGWGEMNFTFLMWLEEAANGLKAEEEVGKAVFKSIVIMGMLVSFNPPRKGRADAANGTGWIVVPITSQGESKSLACWMRQNNRKSHLPVFYFILGEPKITKCFVWGAVVVTFNDFAARLDSLKNDKNILLIFCWNSVAKIKEKKQKWITWCLASS